MAWSTAARARRYTAHRIAVLQKSPRSPFTIDAVDHDPDGITDVKVSLADIPVDP